MIAYEYKCTNGNCSLEFEEDRSMSEDTSTSFCPSCMKKADRHFRTVPSIDTYFEGSFKQQHPVPGI